MEVIARVVDYRYTILPSSGWSKPCLSSCAPILPPFCGRVCSCALPCHSLPSLLTGYVICPYVTRLLLGYHTSFSVGSFVCNPIDFVSKLFSRRGLPARHFWCHAPAAKANVHIHTEGSWFWPTMNKHLILSTDVSRLQTSCQTPKSWYRLYS